MIREVIIPDWRIAQFFVVFLVIFLLGVCQSAYSQHNHPPCVVQDVIADQVMVFALNYTPKPPHVTKQFYNTWTRGVIMFVDGKKTEKNMLCYNAWLDELLWMNENSYQIGVIPKESIQEFTFYNVDARGKESFRNVTTPGMKWGSSFFQVLADGKYTIYCQYNYTFVPGEKDFEKSEVFFIQTKGSMQKFTSNRGGLLSLFPKDQRHELRPVIRKNYPRKLDKTDLANFFGSLNAR